MNRRVLIIGCGNPLRQDDGIGWRAAQLVEERLSNGAAEVITCHQLTPELAAKLHSASVVLFLDAAADEPPGRIRFQAVRPREPGAWTHHLLPEQLLGLARQCQGTLPSAFSIGGGTHRMGFGDGLSATAEECAARIAALALCIIDSEKGAQDQPI